MNPERDSKSVYIQVLLMTYGNALMNTMKRNQHTQNTEVHTSSFIMKRVEMKMTLAKEKIS
ncbi:MAG: hypothetical protein A2736_01995 [Candidatus Yanofskybacteria bacterium RIFCSPHIGHO2_01_FULL_41_27]|uniref:Uncharacterized protein n=2 Tax=Candidatus Yanofskyibacteriota TaxID=1752733 RepID=A0A1F8HW25_9BACT|nr:MAG: hypothetical protein A2736_01995 [Candidatus Yanofskybacteria bacterium RIFCSPHIGHO2_01_FULL_41_27]OGN41732.1 MAG: hypothetical protein A2606_00455 [Candidatus Yanofskybacteria bacterium RIFOXYD1_FULL_42_10]